MNIVKWIVFGCVMLGITFIILAVIGFGDLGIKIYNNTVTLKTEVERRISDLDAEYQRRYALVENLVSIVKETKIFEKYLVEIEKDLYAKVAEAKASATKMDIKMPETIKNRSKKEGDLGNILTNAMDKLMVMAQQYPEIKDPVIKDRTETFKALKELKGEVINIEDRINASRKNINSAVMEYNKSISVFPANILANFFGFSKLTGFDLLNEEAKNDVKIIF